MTDFIPQVVLDVNAANLLLEPSHVTLIGQFV